MFAYISTLTPDSDLDDSPLGKMLQALISNSPSCFPLGYHTNCPPVPFICCDMPGCTLLMTNEEWLLIEGCLHSFHLRCLKGVSFCPICRSHIKTTVGTLATAAQRGIFDTVTTDHDSEDDYEGGQNKEDSISVEAVGKDLVESTVEHLARDTSLPKPYHPEKVDSIFTIQLYESHICFQRSLPQATSKLTRKLV